MIRPVTPSDHPQILAIYSPFIAQSAITFEYDIPAPDDFSQRIEKIAHELPYLVWDQNGIIAGYAYASPYRERKAYQWSVELSVYLHPDFYGKGIAAGLYTELLRLLRIMGYANAYAIITTPNAASEKFHERFGFYHIGVFTKVGYKHNKWHDVRWMGYDIQPHLQNMPAPLKNFNEIARKYLPMKNYETLVDAINDLKKNGYEEDFNLSHTCIDCANKNSRYPAEEFVVDEVHRFEGMTDPDDSAILFAITAADGTKGVLVSAYGVYADTVSNEMMKKLHLHS